MGDQREVPRVWCVAAGGAPVIGVVARVQGAESWTCVLRWNWKERTVEEGAWTRLSIAAHRCRLSPDGEFLFYHGKGPVGGPFDGFYGGAFAVSRLPWLSALTNTETFGPAGGFASRDALSDDEQGRLWGIFESWKGYINSEDWPVQLGDGWVPLSIGDGILKGIQTPRSPTLAAICVAPGARERVIAVVAGREDRHGRTLWDLWSEDLHFFVVGKDGGGVAPAALQDVCWAQPVGGGRVCVARRDSKLQVLRFKYREGSAGPPAVEWEHSLAGLMPAPKPAPAWAKAGLERGPQYRGIV